MHSAIYLFNPDYDMAMANFTPYYKAPAEIIRFVSTSGMVCGRRVWSESGLSETSGIVSSAVD